MLTLMLIVPLCLFLTLTASSKNPVHSILSALLIVIIASGLVIINNNFFLGLSIFIIYTGGIIVVIIFALSSMDPDTLESKKTIYSNSNWFEMLFIFPSLVLIVSDSFSFLEDNPIQLNKENVDQFILEAGIRNYLISWGYETLYQIGILFYIEEATVFSLGIFFLLLILILLIIFWKDEEKIINKHK